MISLLSISQEVKTKELMHISSLSTCWFFFFGDTYCIRFQWFDKAIEVDPYTKKIQDQLFFNPSIHLDFSLSAYHFYYKTRLVIPDNLELRAKILAESHDSPTWGNIGYFENSQNGICKNFLALSETWCQILCPKLFDMPAT